jgi:hypothetical protein
MRSFRYFGLFVLLLASSVDAATRYASPAGSGSACSDQSPCSLNTVISLAQPGDTLILKAGTYTRPNASVTGTSGNLITIRPADGASVKISRGWADAQSTYMHMVAPAGTSLTLDAVRETCSIGIAFIHNSILENLEITNAGSQGIYGVGDSQLINLHVHHNGGVTCYDEPPRHQHGLYTGGSKEYKNNIIDGGSYHDNTGQGIQCYPTCANTTIRNIKSYNNGSWGVLFLGGPGNKIYNSVFYQNDLSGSAGAVCLCSPGVEAYNLTLYNNDGDGIYVDNNGVVIRNSISLGNKGSNLLSGPEAGSTTTSNNIFSGAASDHFVNVAAYDLQIQFTSTARDAGMSISGTFITDLRGITRPQGMAWDIGAYEFIAAQPPAAPSTLTINVAQ